MIINGRALSGLGLIVLALLAGAPAIADDVKLAWDDDANDPRILMGYKIYYGTSPGVYGLPIEVAVEKTGKVPGLKQGVKYYFAVKAYSLWGLESDYSEEISHVIKDTIPPSVSFTSPVPTGSYVSAQNTVSIAGSASDNVGVTQVCWRYRGAVGIAAGATSWTVSDIPLLPGNNDIVVTALDEEGNAGEALIKVSYTPVHPVITRPAKRELSSTSIEIRWLTSIPTDSTVEYGRSIPYSGSVSDPSSVYSHSVILTNLVPGALYHYRLKAQTSSGDLVVSEDFQFTLGTAAQTLSLPRLFIPGLSPRISGAPDTIGSQKLTASNAEYVSIALTNFDSTPASLTFTAFDTGGDQVSGPGIINPATRTLAPGAQLPIIDSELFVFSSAGQFLGGSIKVESNSKRLSGFFMMWDSNLTELDGALLTASPLNWFLLPDIQDQGFTKLNITNVHYDAGTLLIDLVQSNGAVRASKSVQLAGRGSLIADVYGDLFPNSPPTASDYIRVRSSSGLVPYELTGKAGQDMAILSGLDSTMGGTVLYAPQYVVGGNWRSTLSIINVTAAAGSVTLSFFSEDGNQIGQSRSVDIAALGKIYVDDQSLFGPAGQDLVQGYLQIVGNGVRLTGSLRLSGNGDSGFTTALPVASDPATSLVFGQIASDSRYYTGISILNPNKVDATVTIGIYGSDGGTLGTRVLTIPGRQRRAKVLTELFQELVGQSRISGYIRVTADQAVMGYAVFGTHDQKVLSAIPAQPAP